MVQGTVGEVSLSQTPTEGEVRCLQEDRLEEETLGAGIMEGLSEGEANSMVKGIQGGGTFMGEIQKECRMYLHTTMGLQESMVETLVLKEGGISTLFTETQTQITKRQITSLLH